MRPQMANVRTVMCISLRSTRIVFLLGHRFEPIRLHVDVHGEMGAATPGGGTVPVPFPRREEHGVASLDVLSGLAPTLNAHAAPDDEQPLRARMRVPVGPAARLEFYAVEVHRCALLSRGQKLGRRGSQKGTGIGGAERRLPIAEDFHGAIIAACGN